MPQMIRGAPDAWIARALIEAWLADDDTAMTDALDRAYEDVNQVIARLLQICGSTVDVVARIAGVPYEEALQVALADFASVDDGAAGRVARTVLTAWTTDDSGSTAEFVNESGLLNEAPANEIIDQLVGMSCVIGNELARAWGKPFEFVLQSWWDAIGADGDEATHST